MTELFDVVSAFGVRETLVALVVLVAVYMLVVVLRMKSLASSRQASRKGDDLSSARYDDDLAQSTRRKDDLDRFFIPPTPGAARPAESRVEPRVDPRSEMRPIVSKYFADQAFDSPKASGVASFDQEKLTRLERELSSTREELDALRTAFAEARDELRAEVDRLKVSQSVSPPYADSMQLALSGASADEIAARCGIARAEAELVISLARGRGGDAGPAGREGTPGGGRSRYGSY